MLTETILATPPRVLTQEQRAFYVAHGYLLLEGLVEPAWLERLRAVTASFVEASRRSGPGGRHLRPRTGSHARTATPPPREHA